MKKFEVLTHVAEQEFSHQENTSTDKQFVEQTMRPRFFPLQVVNTETQYLATNTRYGMLTHLPK